jgi:DHA1 family multidrug resistance protein-like MFS transporter
MGFVTTAEQLIFLRAVQGLLSGVIAAVSALVVSKVPQNKTGYAMGILQLGLWSGVSLGPLLGGYLSDLFGFHVTFMATAALLCASGIVVWIAVDETHTPALGSSRGMKSFAQNWHRVLRYPGIIATFVLRFFSSVGRTALSPILPLFVQILMPGNKHIAGYTGLVLGVSSAASTIAAVYLGRLGDKIGHQRIAFFSAIGTALFYFPQSFVTKPWQLMVLYTLTGAGIGGLTPSLAALLAKLSKPADAGSVYGIDNSITAAGRALSPLIAAMVAAYFGLRWVFCATGVIFAGAVIIIAVMLPTQKNGPQSEITSPEVIERELAETEES